LSTPVSIQDGLFTTNTLISKKFLIIYFTIIWSSILPLSLEFYIFWKLFEKDLFLFIFLLPFQIYIGYFLLGLSSTFIAKFFLTIINLVHRPREGIFRKNKKDRDYYFWSLRAVIKKWPIWISKFIPLPIITKLNLKWFENDSEFIEYGKHVSNGKGTSIRASMIFRDFLLIQKVKIGDNVIIGANSFIAPGTQIGRNTIIGTMSSTKFNQNLKSNSIYNGFPLKSLTNSNNSIEKIKKGLFETIQRTYNSDNENDQKQKNNSEHKFLKNLNYNLFIFAIIYFTSNAIPILGIIYLGSEFFIPHFLQCPNFLSIFNNSHTLIVFLSTPLVLIMFYIINLIILILIGKILYKIIQYRNPIKEGTFNWEHKNKDFNNYFKRSFLLRYIRWKIQKSPFPWLMKFAFNFIGNCQIGKDTVLEDSYISKELLKVGNNVYIGKSLITNHLWDTNLTLKKIIIGDNVIIPELCCIAPGTKIENNVLLLPLSVTSKCEKLTENSVYQNSPLIRISNQELLYALNIDNNLSEK
jgi:acetyltransferase-like isoleucine patch superfamily enzyme